MVLSHAKEITAAYGTGAAVIKDCVLTVPSFYTQHERMALLDAAKLADLNVLALIDETTASALHFGMDKKEEKPLNALFYNMGGSAVQASVITFYSYDHKETKYGKSKPVGAFEVKGKGWDSTLGGMAFDNKLVDFMAEEFNEVWNKKRGDGQTKDVRAYPRPMTKLRIQANKAKHILSANNDIPVFIDALYDDTHYSSHISRAKFEELSHDLLERSVKPIDAALKAANMTLDDIDFVELIGGGMRVPAIQERIQKYLGDKLELGLHINSDESMALGSAFHGANVSTAFKVRQVGMIDVNPFPIKVSLSDVSGDDESSTEEGEADVWTKEATIFKSFGRTGVKKTIAFTHETDVHCAMGYAESDILPEGTEADIVRYNITGVSKFAKEMAEKGLNKPKVSLQFELSTSGIATLIKAEAAVEEIITVTEEVEVDDEDEKEGKEAAAAGEEKKEETKEGEETPAAAAEGGEEEKKDGEEAEEKKEEPKKKKTKTIEKVCTSFSPTFYKYNEYNLETNLLLFAQIVCDVQRAYIKSQEKKKVHKRTLKVDSYYVTRVQPYSDDALVESQAKLQMLADKDRERIMLEEAKNKVESYIYHIKNKMADYEDQIAKVTTSEQRESILSMASEAEDWLYEDGYDADLATFEDKYAELAGPAEDIFFRLAEMTARPEAIAALSRKLSKVEDLMAKWETEKPQVTEEERNSVMEKVNEARKWIADMQDKQADTDPTDTPAFTSEEVPLQTKGIESLVSRLSK